VDKVCSMVLYEPCTMTIVDMHKLTPTIEEVIAFTMWLSDKQLSAKRAKSEIWVM
jgi:hypothetical protein